jgi:hypothetical protein
MTARPERAAHGRAWPGAARHGMAMQGAATRGNAGEGGGFGRRFHFATCGGRLMMTGGGAGVWPIL